MLLYKREEEQTVHEADKKRESASLRVLLYKREEAQPSAKQTKYKIL